MLSGDRAKLEATIGRIVHLTYAAEQLADDQGLDGTAQDLRQINIELARVGNALISKPKPKTVLGGVIGRQLRF